MKTIGEKIKELRKTKGASQEDLAFELGVSRQTIHKWECNATLPSADNLKALCDYFKISSDYFINDTGITDNAMSTSDENVKNEVANANGAVLVDGRKTQKAKKYLVVYVIITTIVSIALIGSISFTIGLGFIAFTNNSGYEKISLLEIEKYTFYLFLTLSFILCAIDLVMVYYIKKIK